MGFHSIGLTFPNSHTINQICLTTTNSTCHSSARMEVFDEIDRHENIQVDEYNFIERRTLKLLVYLDQIFPTEQWGQFFTGNQIL
jgi:hypothetical protein